MKYFRKEQTCKCEPTQAVALTLFPRRTRSAPCNTHIWGIRFAVENGLSPRARARYDYTTILIGWTNRTALLRPCGASDRIYRETRYTEVIDYGKTVENIREPVAEISMKYQRANATYYLGNAHTHTHMHTHIYIHTLKLFHLALSFKFATRSGTNR